MKLKETYKINNMRKAYFLLTLVFFAAVSGVWGQNFSGGSGTESSPFLISTPEDLDEIRDFLTPGETYYFEQTNDIDLSDFNGGVWVPIGGAGTNELFNGIYDGKGYKILNLNIDSPTTDDIGLFGHIGPTDAQNAGRVEIKNLGIIGSNVNGARGVGALVGRVTGNEITIIENCFVTNGTVTGDAAVGGLVGSNNSYVTGTTGIRRPIIRRSFSTASVIFSGSGSNNEKFGGLVGCNQKGEIRNSYATGKVEVLPGAGGSAERVGGLAGCVSLMGIVFRSYSYGEVNVNSNVTLRGGLTGSLGTSNPGTVEASYWDTETSGQSTSAGGFGRTTAQMQKQATYVGWDFGTIWDIIENESYPFLLGADQLSGFEVTGPESIVAGESFNLQISNASDVNGVILNGFFQVTIITDISGEANGGSVFNNVVQFVSGGTAISNLTLTVADDHQLSISIQSIANAEIQPIMVTPATAVSLSISQQPASVINGNNDGDPANLGNIEIIAIDQFGNPSAVGLDAVQNVTVAIENDGSPGEDAVLGAETMDIQSGTALFTNLTIDREGTGYTLKFTSNSPVALGDVITTPFDVVSIEDQSEFTVSADSPQYSGIEFDVNLSGATDNEGNLLNGDVNITIESDITAEIFSFNGLVTFSAGEAIVPVTLNESDPAGLEHSLSVSVAGIADDKTVAVTVFPDQSGFAIEDPGQQFSGFAFNLQITNAILVNGSDLDGETEVTVTSSTADGLVFSGPVIFSNGAALIPLILNVLGDHDLTVSINGITNDETIEDVNVAENVSGFDVAEILDAQTAGVEFDLGITNAINTDGLLNDSFTVIVTSNIPSEPNEGVVFNEEVSFLEGAATFGVTLTKAANPNQITIAIETILPTKTLDIEVIATAASQLAITQQPTGGSGTNNNLPVNVGTIILETQDEFGNPSTVGLSGTENVTASIGIDASEFDDANLGGTKTKDISSGTTTFDNLTLNREGEGYTLVFTADNINLGFTETDEFDISNINDLRSFEIVDPGPQVVGENFEVNIINATNSDGSLRNGPYSVFVLELELFTNLFSQDVNFTEGAATIFTTNPYPLSGNIQTLFRVAGHSAGQKSIFVLVVDEDDSGFQITDPGPQAAGVPFNLIITDAKDKAGNSLNGRDHFVTVTTTNLDEGTNGLLFSDSLAFTSGGTTIPDIYLEKAGGQTLSVSIDWITDPEEQLVVVNPNIATQLLVSSQPTGNVGDFGNLPVAISTDPVVVTFYDDFDNPSTVGLDDELTLTVDLETDASIGIQANLSGTLIQTLDTETASFVFDDLTLDKDGIGYELAFVFNGTPVIAPVVSAPFNMTDINTYGITLDADDPLVFDDVPVGYDPVVAETITITRIGLGDIVGLTVTLDEVVENSFEIITEPDPDELINSITSTTFTIKPADGLPVGLYEAIVSVTANAELDSEQVVQFGVRFRVLEEFAIEVDVDDPLVFTTVTEGYSNGALEQTVTITNIGFGEITGLTATLGGADEDDFEISVPDPQDITTNNTSTFTIKPDEELEVGTYTATVTVSNAQNAEVSFNIEFTVVKEFIWEGTVSDRWHNAANWDEDDVPGEDDFIRIPSVRAQDPYIWDLNVTVSNLIIESDVELKVRSNRSLTIKEGGRVTVNPGGKLTLNEGTGVLTNNAGVDGLILESDANNTASLILFNGGVDATVERYLYGTHANFQHITSTSVAGQSFESFFADNHGVLGYFEPIYAMREYDEGSGWTPYFNENKEGELQVGTAYIIGPSQPGKLTFKGEIRHNNLTKGLTHTTFGWNGIGNPFTAPIDISSFFDTNLDGFFEGFEALYIYDPANAPGYQTINNTTKEIGGLSEIAIGQGFIVKADEGGANFSFTTGMRKHAEPQFFKDQDIRSNWYSLKLKVSSSIRNMTTLIAFNENMNMGLDATYDAGQFQASSAFNLFTRTPEELSELNLSIQALPVYGLEDVYIPVGFNYPQGGEVTFSAESLNLPEHFEARFYDSQEDIYINLSEEDYTVVLAASSDAVGRFFLLMKSQIMHLVSYDALNDGGEITASVNGESIDTGSMVPDGSSVSFLAIADYGYEIEHWLIDGVILDDVTVSEIIIDELLDDLHVQVSFKETSTQIDETFADDNLIIYIFENQLIIRGEIGKNAIAVLYDMLGRQMRIEQLQPGEFNAFSVEGLKPGAYVILIQENDRRSTRKLLLD
jgi:hypothetical protein